MQLNQVLLAVYRSNANYCEHRQELALAKLTTCHDMFVPFWLQKVTDWTDLMDFYDRQAGMLEGVERFVAAHRRHTEVRPC